MMNKHAKLSNKSTTPVRASRKKINAQDKLCAPKQEVIGLAKELRSHHTEIEIQKKLRKAKAEIIKQKRDKYYLQKSRDALERTIKDRAAELRNTYELLNSIFASIDVHIAYLDPDFNFITVNQVYAAADKRAPDFYFGKNYFDIYPEEETEAIFRDVIETGEPYYEHEKPVISAGHPDRGVTYWDWSVQPVKGPGNTVNGLVLSMINVTDRKRAEENTIRLAAAIESAGDAVIITDVRGMIKYVNPAFEKITGYSQKEAIGRDKYMLDSGKQDEAFYQNVRESIRRQGSWTGRVVNKKKDGALYTEECTWSVIRNQSGEIINYVSIGRDITEKLKLESVAPAVDTMDNAGFIFSGVRHEIGNHINSIIMRLDLLKEKIDQLDKSAINGCIDGSLNEAFKISDLLKTLNPVRE